LENWKKLLEEANGVLEERIRSLFLKEKKRRRGPRILGGESSAVRTVCFWRIADNVVMRLVEGEE
jgi:hypothetical protein